MIVLDEHLYDARLEDAIARWYPGKIIYFCFALSLNQVDELPDLLRTVFKLEPFKTQNSRMGKVARVIKAAVQFYGVHDPTIYSMKIR